VKYRAPSADYTVALPLTEGNGFGGVLVGSFFLLFNIIHIDDELPTEKTGRGDTSYFNNKLVTAEAACMLPKQCEK